MLGIGRKKKDEDNEEIELPKKRKSKVDLDELKDLQPKNKDKRKEPPKPWGKGERIFVLIMIFVTAGTAGILGLSSRSWKLPGMPRIISPELNLEKTYILEADETRDEEVMQIKQQFAEMTKNLSGVYGLYVARLYEDESYGVLEDEQFPAASAMRLPVMTALIIESEESSLSLISNKDLLERMGKSADEEAYQTALETIGFERTQQIIDEIGMSKTSVIDGVTTPADLGKLLKKLWERRLINQDNTNLLFDYMTNTDYEEHMSAGLPTGVRVAHTFGEDVHIVNDAGIIFADSQPLVIVIMSKGVVETEANTIIPQIAELIYYSEIN